MCAINKILYDRWRGVCNRTFQTLNGKILYLRMVFVIVKIFLTILETVCHCVSGLIQIDSLKKKKEVFLQIAYKIDSLKMILFRIAL